MHYAGIKSLSITQKSDFIAIYPQNMPIFSFNNISALVDGCDAYLV